MKVSKQTKLN